MTVSTYKNSDFLSKYERELKARQEISFRQIRKMIGDIAGKKVIDIGTGPGNLAKELSDKGARVIGVDSSEQWIISCKEKYTESKHLQFIHTGGGNLSSIKSKSIDVVIMNVVLPNVDSLQEVEKIFKEVGRVLKKNGLFIFSDLHPILKMSAKIHPDRYQKYLPSFSYFKDGSSFTSGIVFDKKKREKIEFNNRHWTLETYTKFLTNEGLVIYSLTEPTYRKGDPTLLLEYAIPEYLLFGCKKI